MRKKERIRRIVDRMFVVGSVKQHEQVFGVNGVCVCVALTAVATSFLRHTTATCEKKAAMESKVTLFLRRVFSFFRRFFSSLARNSL